jgi:starch synthase (maltosyl-transferring)
VTFDGRVRRGKQVLCARRAAELDRRADGRVRVVVERVTPDIDGGRFPVKRTIGEAVAVEADAFADGHDAITVVLRYRPDHDATWREVAMAPLENDRWAGAFTVHELGRHRYTVCAWVDRFASWRRDLEKKVVAGQDVSIDLCVGAELAEAAAERAASEDTGALLAFAGRLRRGGDDALEAAFDPQLDALAARNPDRSGAATYGRELAVMVDPERARFSSWYELFPRSASPDPGRHGTLRDVEARLDYVAALGFDVLYLPPIHPIGHTNRKGRNGATEAGPDDPGSPWAIGSEDGGHDAVHPELGSIEDLDRLVAAARERGIELALDIAFQCSPDHPYVRKHEEWFRHRPDGTIQYAENPPKRYHDIYPIDFETHNWRELWRELYDVVEFWVSHGVRTFRVDNPHTKPFEFWEWLIAGVRTEHPDVVFLSEAFTRPKVMYRLAKLGFTQSYTYFAWRGARWELIDYFTELTRTEVREYFRPNLWPNTPDILTAELQRGGRPVFISRLVLAATLGASYGIYGPAFELCEHVPREPGSEEYLNSEKYEIRHWDLDHPETIAPLVARLNGIRREHPALQTNDTLTFHGVDNESLIAYSKAAADDVVLVVVSLEPSWTQAGTTSLDLPALGLAWDDGFDVLDLLTDDCYQWHGPHNYVELSPERVAHLFLVRRRTRSERDFEYYA